MKFILYRWLTAVFVLFAVGCSTFSKDGGFSTVQDLVKERSDQNINNIQTIKSEADAEAVKVRVSTLLAKPLSVEGTVEITVLNNRGLQAIYHELGIAEADLVQAGRLKNPTLSLSYLTQGESVEFDRSLVFSLFDALLLPKKTKIEQQKFEQTKIRVASEVLKLIDETRRAYYVAVAAQESINYHQQVKSAADTSNELAKGMVAAGNWSALDQATMQTFLLESNTQLIQAKNDYHQARENLVRLLGLSTEENLVLPARLASLPKKPQSPQMAEAQAMNMRLDLMLAKAQLTTLASELGLTKQTRFINALDVGYENNDFNHEPTEEGVEVAFEIPIFDSGDAKVAKSEAMYQQAVNQAAQMAINARSEVRAAYVNYRSSYDIAKHYQDEVIPLQKRISDEKLLRYNGMLISVFDLLEDAKTQAQRVNEALNAKRNYWLAEATLHMALVGTAVPENTLLNAEP